MMLLIRSVMQYMNCIMFDEDWSMSCGEHGSSGVTGVGTITTLDCFDILTSWSIIMDYMLGVRKIPWMFSA